MKPVWLAPLIGAGAGAVGGALVAPDEQRKGDTVSGAIAGALTGGLLRGIAKHIKGKEHIKSVLRKTKSSSALRDAGINTGITAAVSKVTGRYDKDKENSSVAGRLSPFIDDAIMAGRILASKGRT